MLLRRVLRRCLDVGFTVERGSQKGSQREDSEKGLSGLSTRCSENLLLESATRWGALTWGTFWIYCLRFSLAVVGKRGVPGAGRGHQDREGICWEGGGVNTCWGHNSHKQSARTT